MTIGEHHLAGRRCRGCEAFVQRWSKTHVGKYSYYCLTCVDAGRHYKVRQGRLFR